MAEGVFHVLTFFTPTNQHVIYYHKGKRTIRVFRSSDGRQLADMKCPTKVRQALGTHDGRGVVVGYEDGAIQMFLIVDHTEPSHIEYLKNWRKFYLDSTMKETQSDGNERQGESTMT